MDTNTINNKSYTIRRKGINSTWAQTLLYVILAANILLVMMPVLITFLLSLKSAFEHETQPLWVLPKMPKWGYYILAFNNIYKYALNTLFICFATTAGVVLFSAAAAYVFSRHTFPLKETLFSLILALMIVPTVLTLTPSYLVVLNLKLIDTHWALILPGIAGGQVGAIFMFRTFFTQQPKDLYESATIDGANDLRMFFNITLPLGIPVLIIQAIGTFSLMYSDFLWPTLVMKTDELKTLMPVLKAIAEKSMQEPGVSYAMYLISGAPLIIISLFGLKYFINGDYASGMKL